MADRGLTAPVRTKNWSPRKCCGAPRVPTREPVASAPGGSGWIPVPKGRLVHPRFCWD